MLDYVANGVTNYFRAQISCLKYLYIPDVFFYNYYHFLCKILVRFKGSNYVVKITTGRLLTYRTDMLKGVI